MKIGLFTDGLMHLSFSAALEKASGMGIQAIEIGTGNFSPAPHCDVSELLTNRTARQNFLSSLAAHGLQLEALNCSGNPLHPNPQVSERAAHITRMTLELAGLLGVERVICMSGCPGAPGNGRYPNWVVAAWPEDFLELLEWQWS